MLAKLLTTHSSLCSVKSEPIQDSFSDSGLTCCSGCSSFAGLKPQRCVPRRLGRVTYTGLPARRPEELACILHLDDNPTTGRHASRMRQPLDDALGVLPGPPVWKGQTYEGQRTPASLTSASLLLGVNPKLDTRNGDARHAVFYLQG